MCHLLVVGFLCLLVVVFLVFLTVNEILEVTSQESLRLVDNVGKTGVSGNPLLSSVPTPVREEENDDPSCAAWSLQGFRAGMEWENMTLPDGDGEQPTVMKCRWTRERSGAPSAKGTISGSLAYPMDERRCRGKRTGGGGGGETDPIRQEAVNTWCGSNSDASTAKAIVLSPKGFQWTEMFHTHFNVWHVHANLFQLWLSVKLVEKPYDYIVLLIPPPYLQEMEERGKGAFLASDDSLHVFLNQSVNARLTSIQSMADAIPGKVIVASPSVSMRQLQSAAGRDLEVVAWAESPRNGLLWDLAWDSELSLALHTCRYSLIWQYRENMLRRYGKPPDKIARHVCFISRQERNERTLSPNLLLHLLHEMDSPILLHPKLQLRNTVGDSVTTMRFLSLSEQMYLIHSECAVLVGVHGAGLTSGMGLRPGASMVELQNADATYQYFRNVAALIPNVTYEMFRFSTRNDYQMEATEDEKQRLVKLVHFLLTKSIQRQQELLRDA